MPASLFVALTLLAALGSGLMAGTFFAFSCFVMQALGRLAARDAIAAMQAINLAVLNPLFFAVFFGTAAICVLLAVASLSGWPAPPMPYLVFAALLYLLGGVGVTILGDVPRNQLLAQADPARDAAAALWRRHLAAWTAWNHVRTLACAAAMTVAILALV